MAADLLILGLEAAAAVTLALLAVILLRSPVRALFGARAAYGLWLLVPAVLVAVALPRGPELAPAAVPPIAAAVSESGGAIAPAAPSVNSALPRLTIERPDFMPNPADFAAPLLFLWLLGSAAYGVVLTVGQRRFLAGLGTLRREQRPDGPVFHAARPDVGPALVGAWSPRVVLPADFAERFSPEEQAVVVAHERVHLTGGDAQINLAVAALRVLFWFNPLIHLAARLIRADQELACDETVIARHPAVRRLYAEAMLKTQFASAPAPLGCHWLAGGKAELRRRILRLTRVPGPGRRSGGLAAVMVLTLGGAAVAWAAQPSVESAGVQARPTASADARGLVAAILDGDNPRAMVLVDAGADVNSWVPGDGTPLILAVRNGQLGLAEALLDRGADPNLVARGEGAALIAAADRGDLAMVRLLLAHRADPDIAIQGDGNPLIAASGSGHLEIVELLLAAGATVDAIVPSDETALITAARRGQLPVVRRLVEAGADVNLAVRTPRVDGSELRSPLGMARRAGRTDIVDYLLAHGARPA